MATLENSRKLDPNWIGLKKVFPKNDTSLDELLRMISHQRLTALPRPIGRTVTFQEKTAELDRVISSHLALLGYDSCPATTCIGQGMHGARGPNNNIKIALQHISGGHYEVAVNYLYHPDKLA